MASSRFQYGSSGHSGIQVWEELADKEFLTREEAAEGAEAAFDRVFRDHDVPDEIPEHKLGSDGGGPLAGVLADAGVAASRSEARRLIRQGAVRADGRRIDDETLDAGELAGAVIQVGKRRFVRFVQG